MKMFLCGWVFRSAQTRLRFPCLLFQGGDMSARKEHTVVTSGLSPNNTRRPHYSKGKTS